MARAHNVQTPGAAAPADTPSATDTSGLPVTTPPEAGDQGDTSTSPTITAPVPPAEPETPKAKKVAAKPTREDYAKMRAADVDPTTITAPVLTLDGYVVPAPKDGK